jgi:hypothetical protein
MTMSIQAATGVVSAGATLGNGRPSNRGVGQWARVAHALIVGMAVVGIVCSASGVACVAQETPPVSSPPVGATTPPAAGSSSSAVGKGVGQEKQESQQGQQGAERQTQGEGQEGQGDKSEAVQGDDDAQLFYNPKYDDAALPVRREEEWTPPPPIDWSIEGVLELTFDHLKFNIQAEQAFEVRQLTLDLLKLRGRTIKIRGFVRPSFKEKNITRFVFVRDNQECCFGPGALLYDCMLVNMAESQSVNFSTRPITLEGRFELKPFRGPDKRVWAIFELNDAVLK